MPSYIDITRIFYEPVTLLFEDHFGQFSIPGWKCRQCGYQTIANLRHLCTSYLN